MNKQQTSKHICFYSNRCEWSKAFLTELSQTQYSGDFTFICVDVSPTRPQLPGWLKKVPTLVISGETEPRTDGDVMNWLYEKNLSMPAIRQLPNGTSSDDNGGSVANEPLAFIDTEMGGSYGDVYSFLDADTSTAGNGGNTMVHNFEFLGGSTSIGTKEGASIMNTGGSGKRSKKEEMLDSQLEAYKKDRDAGIPKRVARS